MEHAHEGPIRIAPAPFGSTSINANADGDAEQSKMLYACQQCANRKIKCDKVAPICSSCRKGRLKCIYHAPPPRRRKRKLSGDMSEKLARYERILRQHDLLPPDDDTSPSSEATPQEVLSLRYLDSQTSRNASVWQIPVPPSATCCILTVLSGTVLALWDSSVALMTLDGTGQRLR